MIELVKEYSVVIGIVFITGMILIMILVWVRSLEKYRNKYLVDLRRVSFSVASKALREDELVEAVKGKRDDIDKDVAMQLLVNRFGYTGLELFLIDKGKKEVS